MHSGSIRKTPREWVSSWPTKHTPDKMSPAEKEKNANKVLVYMFLKNYILLCKFNSNYC